MHVHALKLCIQDHVILFSLYKITHDYFLLRIIPRI
jgi:hypothetical protein